MKSIPIVAGILAITCIILAFLFVKTLGDKQAIATEYESYRSAKEAKPTKNIFIAPPTQPQPQPPPAPTDTLEQLRTEIKALQMRIKSKDIAIARLQEAAQNAATTQPTPTIKTTSAAASWMDRLRERDPARYERLIAAQNKQTSTTKTSLTDQLALIAQIDPSAFPTEEQEQLIKLQEGFDTMEQLLTELQKEDISRAEAFEKRRQLGTINRALTPFMPTARKAAIITLARQNGYSEQGATQLVTEINRIYELTQRVASSSGR